MGLYLRLATLTLRAQLSQGSNFVLTAIGNFVTPLFVLAGLEALFARFGSLRGWTASEVMVCFGAIHLSFATAECFARGFDLFSNVLSSGEFERLLLRPRSTLAQTLAARFEFTRVGRFVVGAATLAAGLAGTPIDWNIARIITLILMIGCGALLFGGIFMLSASLCFVSLEAIEMVNVLTDGGRELSQYPLTIYGERARRVFTFIVPFGCVNYLPLRYLLGVPGSSALNAGMPLLVLPFVLFCALVWRAGVKRFMREG